MEKNYDDIYQETASKQLLLSRKNLAALETKLERLVRQLYIDIVQHLSQGSPVIAQKKDSGPVSVKSDLVAGTITLCVDLPTLDPGEGPLQDSHSLYFRCSSKQKLEDSLSGLGRKAWFPQSGCCDELLENLLDIRSIAQDYEEATRKYCSLEVTHLKQFDDYARKRMEKEGLMKDGEHFRFLCALDTFCTIEEDNCFSCQTLVLVRSDLNYDFVSPELGRVLMRVLQHSEMAEDLQAVREHMDNPLFLHCKLGGYYPLTFEQLWDQMIVGLNLSEE